MFDYSFVFGVALSAFLICVVNLVYTYIQRRTDKSHNRIFIAMYLILAINASTEIVSSIYADDPSLAADSPNTVRVEVLSEVLGLSGVMMSVENEDERLYSGTRFYNRAAMNLDLGGCLTHNRKLSLIMIHIHNYDNISRLVEGVETIDQVRLLEKLKVDYLQGYYFSRPIPKNDFVKLISIAKARK